jgi:hypothetical protein
MCKFKLPTAKIPVPSLSLPTLPALPKLTPPDLDFPVKLKLPKIKVPIPSLSLPTLPSLPKLGLDPSLLDLGLKLPKLPSVKPPIPSFSLPALPKIPQLGVGCPFE